MAFLCHILIIALSFSVNAKDIDRGDFIIVIADKTKTPQSKSASSTHVIKKEEIESSHATHLHELLKQSSGVHIANSGPKGSNSSLFIRGSESNHVLVLIDGVEANDPSNPNRQFDFSTLSLSDIERVEILKGSQSVLYGSDAIGGVISITTKSKRGISKSSFRINYGSFNTLQTNARYNGVTSKGRYSLGYEYQNSDGFSAANGIDNPGAEEDGFNLSTFTGSLSDNRPGLFRTDLSLRYVRGTSDIDRGGGAANDDPNDILENEKLYYKVQLSRVFFDDLIESKLSFSSNMHDREFIRRADSTNSTESIQQNQGNLYKIAFQNDFLFSNQQTTTFGLEQEIEKDSSRVSTLNQNSAKTISTYLHHKIITDSFFMSIGSRLDSHEQFGEQVTYKISPGYYLRQSQTKLRTSFTTGFKAPSLSQLYGQVGGNPNLIPEESKSFEIGFDQNLFSLFDLSATYFDTKINNRFSFNPSNFQSINAGDARLKGLELELGASLTSFLESTINYTLLSTEDLATGLKLVRRPKHALYMGLNLKATDSWHIFLDIEHIGTRDDLDANNFNRTENHAYTLVGLRTHIIPREDLKIWLRLDNIFNEKYEEIDGFGTAGRSGRVGLNLIF